MSEDSSWAMVDFPNGDCDINSSHVSDDPNSKSGCSISSSSVDDINISLYPHHFDLYLKLKNIPTTNHNDFIYMGRFKLHI